MSCDVEIAVYTDCFTGAGLNWLRIPIAFWAIETWDDEPFLEKVSWT